MYSSDDYFVDLIASNLQSLGMMLKRKEDLARLYQQQLEWIKSVKNAGQGEDILNNSQVRIVVMIIINFCCLL